MKEKQNAALGTAPLGRLMLKFALPCTVSLLAVPLVMLLPRAFGLMGVLYSMPAADILTFFASCFVLLHDLPADLLLLFGQARFVLGNEFQLVPDGHFHRFAALFKTAEVLEPLFERAQRGIVHCTVELLAVAGDEGDGVALVEQAHDVFNVPGVFAEFGGKGLNEIHKMFLSYIGRRSGAVK